MAEKPAGSTAPGGFSRWLASHWSVTLVLGLFAASTLIIPTLVNVPIGDDWVYTRSVEILVKEGRLDILDLSVVTLVFQVVWAALFSVLDVSFATTRMSTVVLVFLSGIAMYALSRELGVSRQRSGLGAALYLFNPLTFGLAFTYMTDPHYTALMVIALWLYVRGFRDDRLHPSTILLASAAASLAFLVRQQGLLIPFAVGLYLVLAGRWRPNRAGFRASILVAGLPALTMVLYYLWLLLGQGAPEQQGAFLDQMVQAGWSDTRILVSRMTYIEIAYIGLFVLPLTIATIPSLRPIARRIPRAGILLFGGWTAIAIAGYLVFAGRGSAMPYIGQYAGVQGIGPTDLRGGRPALIGDNGRLVLTWIALGSSLIFALVLASRFFRRDAPERSRASLVTSIGIWQVVGVLPPSFHFRNWIISVDRYLLPLLPVAIVLLLWSLRNVRIVQPLAWIMVLLYACYSIAGTRDMLVFQDATWDLASQAIEAGVPLTALDAGASWDGYYLYDYSIENGIRQQTPGGPWWTNLFGPATTSEYVVATQPQEGYVEVMRTSYSTWLDGETHPMYLLRKADLQ